MSNSSTPSFLEDHISQIPALQLLQNLGYTYLTPAKALKARGNKASNVLLEEVLIRQLRKINNIQFKGKEPPFTEDQRFDLKKKFARTNPINNSEQTVKRIAWDISVHFSETWGDTAHKAQLVAPNKATALLYKQYL